MTHMSHSKDDSQLSSQKIFLIDYTHLNQVLQINNTVMVMGPKPRNNFVYASCYL